MVEFLPGAPATLIESITGKVYDAEGVHDRGCVWEFFSGCAYEPGESIHRYDLDVLAPCVRLEANQVWKTFLERPGIISRSQKGPRRSRMGVTSKMTVTILVAIGGMVPHVFINTNDAHPHRNNQDHL